MITKEQIKAKVKEIANKYDWTTPTDFGAAQQTAFESAFWMQSQQGSGVYADWGSDGEVAFKRATKEGIRYFIVDTDFEVSSLLVTNDPGEYVGKHSKDNSLKKLFADFMKGETQYSDKLIGLQDANGTLTETRIEMDRLRRLLQEQVRINGEYDWQYYCHINNIKLH